MDDTLGAGETDGAPVQSQDTENLQERNLRQAAERERLMRQMEMEEAGIDIPGKSGAQKGGAQNVDEARDKRRASLFPPPFPESPEGVTPFELLERYEKLIFDKIGQQ